MARTDLRNSDRPAPWWDEELRRAPDDAASDVPTAARSRAALVMVVVLLAAGVIAAFVVFGRRPPGQPSAVDTPKPPAAAASPQPLGGDAAPIALPPLAESDPLVRELVRKLSSHPSVTAWLATDGLIRNFTVVVSNVAEGTRFTTLLPKLRPSSPFLAAKRNNDVYVDPRGYERYTSLAEGVSAIDPQGSARLYATLKPRIEDAHRELGEPNASFDRTLERAIVSLLETPAVEGPIRLRTHGAIAYRFADERLEALTPAQKLLLRMGPRNAHLIQAKLRDIALALGIPASRLPVSTVHPR